VIDNKPGASGVIATTSVTKATPDGYTLLYTNASATVMAEALIPNLPFSTLRDLVPVALNAVGGVLLVVNPELPARTLPELIDLIKRNPEKYAYGSWGVGSNGHLSMEWLKLRTGMKAAHVPYKTTPSLLTDLVSGVVAMGWVDISSPLGFIQQGRLRAIAINGELRIPRLPDLKTMTEQGHPFPALGFQGIFAPVGTPPAIVQRLNTEVARVLAQPEYQATLRRMNVEPPPILSTAQFQELISSNLQTWKKIATQANIQLDS
jgi:tripartite-type tricarboxylate transporter receptor subunit TctC